MLHRTPLTRRRPWLLPLLLPLNLALPPDPVAVAAPAADADTAAVPDPGPVSVSVSVSAISPPYAIFDDDGDDEGDAHRRCSHPSVSFDRYCL
ncbi:MAG: hypothetical protein GY906_36810 [bacterium]|nr:hypothetical protein [bacterium]